MVDVTWVVLTNIFSHENWDNDEFMQIYADKLKPKLATKKRLSSNSAELEKQISNAMKV